MHYNSCAISSYSEKENLRPGLGPFSIEKTDRYQVTYGEAYLAYSCEMMKSTSMTLASSASNEGLLAA